MAGQFPTFGAQPSGQPPSGQGGSILAALQGAPQVIKQHEMFNDPSKWVPLSPYEMPNVAPPSVAPYQPPVPQQTQPFAGGQQGQFPAGQNPQGPNAFAGVNQQDLLGMGVPPQLVEQWRPEYANLPFFAPFFGGGAAQPQAMLDPANQTFLPELDAMAQLGALGSNAPPSPYPQVPQYSDVNYDAQGYGANPGYPGVAVDPTGAVFGLGDFGLY